MSRRYRYDEHDRYRGYTDTDGPGCLLPTGLLAGWGGLLFLLLVVAPVIGLLGQAFEMVLALAILAGIAFCILKAYVYVKEEFLSRKNDLPTTTSREQENQKPLHDTEKSLKNLNYSQMGVDELEERLNSNEGRLALSEVKVEIARLLASTRGTLTLSRITTLSPEVARELAKHAGRVSLDQVFKISPAVAKALAKHGGQLFLNGVTTLSPQAAVALSKHQGRLSLNGVTALCDEAAKALAKHRGRVDLSGLVSVSEEAAIALRANADIQLPTKLNQ